MITKDISLTLTTEDIVEIAKGNIVSTMRNGIKICISIQD